MESIDFRDSISYSLLNVALSVSSGWPSTLGQEMEHARTKTLIGVTGVLVAWFSFGAALLFGIPLVYKWSSEVGSRCGTERLIAETSIQSLAFFTILAAGVGWGVASTTAGSSRAARMGFVGTLLTSLFFLWFVTSLARTLLRTFG